MTTASWAALVPVMTAMVGVAGSIIAVIVVQYQTTKREREAKVHDAAERRRHRWDEFELKTLLELQEAVGDLIGKPMAKVAAVAIMNCKKPAAVADVQAANTATADLIRAQVRVTTLAVRVGGKDLIGKIIKLVNLVNDAGNSEAGAGTSAMDTYIGKYSESINLAATDVIVHAGALITKLRPDAGASPMQ